MNILYALLFSFTINGVMFLVAYKKKTDKLTDISYALTFFSLVTYGAIAGRVDSTYHWVLAFMVTLWAVRIGSYLLMRIRKIGKDKRFDDKRDNFVKFGSFWALQAITVWIVMLGALKFLSVSVDSASLSYMAVGFAIWGVGLVVEAIADMQKFVFINDSKNKGKWIDTGLWKYSRHPNYFGEILVWVGVFVYVSSALSGVNQLIAFISPLFIAFLLIFVSGIPLLEKSADKRWGNDKRYQKYKDETSILVPLPK